LLITIFLAGICDQVRQDTHLDNPSNNRYGFFSKPAGRAVRQLTSVGFSFFGTRRPFMGATSVQYTKPALSFEAQADLMLGRGMIGDREVIIRRLQAVSYYRLSGYSHPFRAVCSGTPGELRHEFKPGTTFEDVWRRYVFDRRLRLIVMDALERIEVAVRALVATHHAARHGLFGYALDPGGLPAMDDQHRARFIARYADEQIRSKDIFVGHFRRKYGDAHEYLPVWMATEIMSFGTLLTLLNGCHADVQRAVSAPFGVHHTVFASWMLMFNTVRNICAHHARLWNRDFGTKPKIPDKIPEWRTPIVITGDRAFAALTICKWCLDRVAPQSRWPQRVRSLLHDNPGVPLRSMGFPDRWESCPIWTRSTR
jgi:abortive infection bacteriophage resistance protein